MRPYIPGVRLCGDAPEGFQEKWKRFSGSETRQTQNVHGGDLAGLIAAT
jgi:hypothetical protein